MNKNLNVFLIIDQNLVKTLRINFIIKKMKTLKIIKYADNKQLML